MKYRRLISVFVLVLFTVLFAGGPAMHYAPIWGLHSHHHSHHHGHASEFHTHVHFHDGHCHEAAEHASHDADHCHSSGHAHCEHPERGNHPERGEHPENLACDGCHEGSSVIRGAEQLGLASVCETGHSHSCDGTCALCQFFSQVQIELSQPGFVLSLGRTNPAVMADGFVGAVEFSTGYLVRGPPAFPTGSNS